MLDERLERLSHGESTLENLNRPCCRGLGRCAMNIVVLLIILLLLFGGGGFYMGGPLVGGSLGGLILLGPRHSG